MRKLAKKGVLLLKKRIVGIGRERAIPATSHSLTGEGGAWIHGGLLSDGQALPYTSPLLPHVSLSLFLTKKRTRKKESIFLRPSTHRALLLPL